MIDRVPGTNGRALMFNFEGLFDRSHSNPSTGLVGGFGGIFGERPPKGNFCLSGVVVLLTANLLKLSELPEGGECS